MRTVILILLLAIPTHAVAQVELPPPVKKGLDALRSGRCEDAFALWTGTWPEPQKSQMAASCSALKQYGHEIYGYDVLRVLDITPHVRRVYAVLLYEVQPIYIMVVAYRPGDGDWKVGTVNWHTDPDLVIPSDIAPPQRPKGP